MQGDCTSAPLPVNPGGAELAALRKNDEGHTQCVVFTPSDLFRVEEADGQQLWIDNLYLRIAKNSAAEEQVCSAGCRFVWCCWLVLGG